MAKGDHTDLYMIFKDDMGRLIQGESTAELGSSDQISKNLLKDFNSGKHTIFEIESFSLSANSDDKSPAEIISDIKKENAKASKPAAGAKQSGTKEAVTKEVLKEGTPEFKAELNKRLAQQNGPPVREITFKRSVDASSAAFMSNLVAGRGYESASLIKRKSTGGKTDAKKDLAADVYLRIDFGMVLVTDVEWDDDDTEVSESITFICRTIDIQYRPQLPSGKLGAIKNGKWAWQKPKAAPS